VTVKLPAATPVAVTVQLPDERVQLAPTVPTAVLDEVKLTEPEGTFDGVVVSVTVTVHVEVPPGRIVLGPQETLVDVLSFVTVIVPEVPELPLWVVSPPYVPVTVKLPGATPLAVTVQLPDDRLQLAPTVPTVVSDDVNVTLPVGVFDGVVVSETVTVHVEVPPMLIEDGTQDTEVEVLSRTTAVTVIVPEVPELPLWVVSPPYIPVTVKLPEATPVTVTVQLPDGDRVQLASTVPTVVSDDVNVTLPVGVFDGVVVSETVTVHVEVPPMLMLLGEQATAVEVLSSDATLNMTVVVWISEPLVPVTVTVTLPVDVNVHDSVEVPEPPITLGGVRVQAVLSLVRSTVPVKPLTGAIVIVEVPGELTTTGTVVGLAVIVKSDGGVTVTDMVAVELVMSLLVPPAPLIVRE
jgi:hypothetical protein